MVSSPHDRVTHTVALPATATLYDPAGHAITVPAHDAAHWITTYGFRATRIDLDQARAEIPILFTAAERALIAYLDDVRATGAIDTTAAQAAALHALDLLVSHAGRIIEALGAAYPVRQAPGVRMRTPEGAITYVDPGQVSEYETKHGFVRASASDGDGDGAVEGATR